MTSGRREERVHVFGAGRVCGAAGCDTVLSTYNPTTCCVVHKSCQSTPRPRSAASPRPDVARACANAACGRMFEAASPKRRYCSDRCRMAAFQQRRRQAEAEGSAR
jgi:hypothetical protein